VTNNGGKAWHLSAKEESRIANGNVLNVMDANTLKRFVIGGCVLANVTIDGAGKPTPLGSSCLSHTGRGWSTVWAKVTVDMDCMV